MSSLPLTGFVGSHPLGALAAFGLLRILSGPERFGTPTLSWELHHDWVAVLHTNLEGGTEQGRAAVLQALVERLQERSAAPFLTFSDDIKVPPSAFAHLLREQTHLCNSQHREVVDFFAAFGSEAVRARSKEEVTPTALHLTSGPTKFLKAAREVAASLDLSRSAPQEEMIAAMRQNIEAAFARAVFGPWRRLDRMHGLGWDPATEALYALLATAPGEEKPFCERAAVWLAFEALPLFPCFPSGARLQTRGFDPRAATLSWPIWRPAISVRTLASLLAHPALIAQSPDMTELLPRGVVAVYRSACERDDHHRGTFRHAVLCAGASSRTSPLTSEQET